MFSGLLERNKARRKIEELQARLRATEDQLAESESWAALGRLVAATAHELQGPLATLHADLTDLDRDVHHVGALARAYRECLGPGIPEAVREIEDRIDLSKSLDRIDDLVPRCRSTVGKAREALSRLRDHARLDRSGRSAIDLNSLVRATLELAGPEARRRQVRLDFQPEGVPEVDGAPGRLAHLVLTLVLGAVHSAPTDGRGRVSVTTRQGERAVELVVTDNGTGSDEPASRARLGIALADDLLGRLACEGRPGEGTTCVVTLPRPATNVA